MNNGFGLHGNLFKDYGHGSIKLYAKYLDDRNHWYEYLLARDPQNLRYYYKSYDDQTIRMVDLKQLDLNAKAIKLVSTSGQQPVADMTGQVK